MTTRDADPTPIRPGFPPLFKRSGTVYALTFEMDAGRPDDADAEIRRVLKRHGFRPHPGGLYAGGPAVDAVSATLAVIALTTRLPWFATAVRAARLLRIEESNDLMPAVRQLAGRAGEITDGGHPQTAPV